MPLDCQTTAIKENPPSSCLAWQETLAKWTSLFFFGSWESLQVKFTFRLRGCSPFAGSLVGPGLRPGTKTAGRGSVVGRWVAWRHGDGLAGARRVCCSPLPGSFRSPQFNGTVLNWIPNWRDAVIPSPHVASLRCCLSVVHLSSFSEGANRNISLPALIFTALANQAVRKSFGADSPIPQVPAAGEAKEREQRGLPAGDGEQTRARGGGEVSPV